jgi:hypothetical protein
VAVLAVLQVVAGSPGGAMRWFSFVHEGFSPNLFWRHQSRFSILVRGYECKCCLRNFAPGLAGPASPPSLNSDCHRCSADSQNAGVETDFIPNKNRSMKNHSVYGNSRATAATPPACGICPGKIHLRHQPTTENVSGGIGVRGHGNRADQRFTFGRVSCRGHILLKA